MASRIGGALSPLLVVPIQRAYGWRASFFVFGVLGLVWAFAWYRSYRDRPSESAGITPQELAEIDVDSSGAHARLPWGIALRRWNFWKILLMYHTYCWGAYFYLSWLHTYLERGRGFSEGEMALASTLPFIAGIGGNLFGGWLSDRLTISHGLRIGRRVVGATGLAASGLLMLTAAITTSKWIALACLTLGYGSMDCMLPVSWAVCLDIGRRYAGSVGGTMNMAGQLGSFLSSVAFGYIVTWTGSYDAPLYPMAALLLVSAVFFARIDPTEQLIPAELA
jgi:predicted MFS family arabinose efflux permease